MSRYPQVDFGHTSYEAAFGRADVYDVAAAMAIVEAINRSLERHAEIDLSAEGLTP